MISSTSPGRTVEIASTKKDDLKCMIQQERKITTCELVKSLNISKGSLSSMLHELGIRKLASRFVPRFLTLDMMNNRFECCNVNLRAYEEMGTNFLFNIITEDETPLSLYLPESKRKGLEWKMPGESASRKLRASTSHRRQLMLTVFWDMKGCKLIDHKFGVLC